MQSSSALRIWKWNIYDPITFLQHITHNISVVHVYESGSCTHLIEQDLIIYRHILSDWLEIDSVVVLCAITITKGTNFTSLLQQAEITQTKDENVFDMLKELGSPTFQYASTGETCAMHCITPVFIYHLLKLTKQIFSLNIYCFIKGRKSTNDNYCHVQYGIWFITKRMNDSQ